MKFSNEQEVINAIQQLVAEKQDIIEIYGSQIERTTVLVAIYLGIKEFNISNFRLVFSGWYSIFKELMPFTFSIHKSELDIDCWLSCGYIKGKYLNIDQAYAKLKSLDTLKDTLLYQIHVNKG